VSAGIVVIGIVVTLGPVLLVLVASLVVPSAPVSSPGQPVLAKVIATRTKSFAVDACVRFRFMIESPLGATGRRLAGVAVR
jgi:hypothetical protein